MRPIVLIITIASFLISTASAAQPACNPEAPITQITRGYDNSPADNDSSYYDLGISEDGNRIVFASDAANLVPGDTNGNTDVFLYERLTCTITRVSVDSSGGQGSGRSWFPAISANGRYMVFDSTAANLIDDDTNNTRDVFMRDLDTGITTIVSLSSDEEQGDLESYGASISADGRYIAFVSRATNFDAFGFAAYSAFVRDTVAGTTELVTVSTSSGKSFGAVTNAAISADGCCIAFTSSGGDLVSGDGNGEEDVFVRDLSADQTERVSLPVVPGEELNDYSILGSISHDGRYVTFHSHATNAIDGDNNTHADSFITDREADTTQLISQALSGVTGSDHAEVSRGWIGNEGRIVLFESRSAAFVTGDQNNAVDIFMRDQFTRQTTLVSRVPGGALSDNNSHYGAMTPDGRYLVFTSDANNLVPGYENFWGDVFLVRLPEISILRNVYATDTPSLSWSGVTWATGYELEVATDAAFTDIVYHNAALTVTDVSVDPLVPRLYYWRVRAQRANGGVGAWSRVETFTLTE